LNRLSINNQFDYFKKMPTNVFYDAIIRHTEEQKRLLKDDEDIYMECYDGVFHMSVSSVKPYGPSNVLLKGKDDKGNSCCLFCDISSIRLITTIVKRSRQGRGEE
jgi:hypothetical protein